VVVFFFHDCAENDSAGDARHVPSPTLPGAGRLNPASSEPTPPAPAFMMDHMLIRTGKYLRICGFDAEWQRGVRTHELIRRANAEERVFVTRNRHIGDSYPAPRALLVLTTADPVAQFREILAACHLDPRPGLFRKCIRCNRWLKPLADRELARGRVPPDVLKRQKRFWSCPACGTVFWHGGHVRNTCRKLGLPLP